MNGSTGSPLRILIADDHRLVRMGIVAMLEGVPGLRVVAEAESGAEAVARFREHQPDICLLDLRMPVLSGFEAIRAILAEFPQARILVVSTYDGDEDIHRALEAGARGYVFKDIVRAELAEAVRVICAGREYLAPAVRRKLAEREDCSSLSTRELEVLTLVAKGFNNLQVAGLLHLTIRTVKFHMSNILSKMGVADRTEAVSEALQRGIIHLE